MNPAITDILVRAWRTWKGWIYLCLGIASLLAGVCATIVWMVSDSGREDVLAAMLLFATLLYPGVLVGNIVGLARIPREQRPTGDVELFPRSLQLSRLPLAAWFPAAVLVANVIFMTILVLRLAPGLDPAALAHSFTLTGMWSVPVVPPILIAVLVSMLLMKRWVLALGPLRLPQNADVRQQADRRLRKLALEMTYGMAIYVTWVATMAQNALFFLDVYPNTQNLLAIAGLDDWYFLYYILVTLGWLFAFMALQFSDFSPRQRRGMDPNGRGEVHAVQS